MLRCRFREDRRTLSARAAANVVAEGLSAVRFVRASALLVGAVLTLAPAPLFAQLIDFRFVGIDMSGGAVWPSDSRVGVVFGARLGFADLLGRALHAGLEIDWWSADRKDADLEVRDALGGLAFWKELAGARTVRPYLGLGAAFHSLDLSRRDGTQLPDGGSPAAEPEGVRVGLSGFAGLAIRLTQTGAIRLVVEYRYVAVSDVANHQLRVGARLGSGS
jgi:hypothetical protein